MYKIFCLLFLYQICYTVGQNKLMATLIENVMECMTEAPDNFTLEVCQEMLKKENDNSQNKYKPCKCLGACTSKRMGIMDANGAGVRSKVEQYISEIDTEAYKIEAKKMLDKCADVPGKHCELSYNFMVCVFENSQMVRELVKTFTSYKEEE